jgi:uncharacterized protein YndB with AHSA1/START domain
MKAEREPHGSPAGPGALRIERLLPGPPERIWAYLTESGKRALWLAGGPMGDAAGGKVELRFRHADLSAEKDPPARYGEYKEGHAVHGTLLRCEPMRVLSYTWGDGGEDSRVTFELVPKGEEVLLIVTHERLRSRDGMASVAAGWHAHLGILLDRLEGREPRGFWTAHGTLEAEYARLLQDAAVAGKGPENKEGGRA